MVDRASQLETAPIEVGEDTDGEFRLKLARVYSLSREKFLNFFNSNEDEFFSASDNVFAHEVSEVFRELEQFDADPTLSKSETANEFLNALIDVSNQMILAKRFDILEKKLDVIQEKLFSYSPNLSDRCSFIDLIELSVKANESPSIQGSIGKRFIHSLNYDLAFTPEADAIVKIKNTIAESELAQKLEIIQILQTIAATGVANMPWAQKTVFSIQTALDEMLISEDSLVVKEALSIAKDSIVSELDEPSLSFFTYKNNPQEGRLTEDVSESDQQESDRLRMSVRLDVPLRSGDHLLRLNDEYIGIFDQSGVLQYWVPLKKNEVAPAPVLPVNLDTLKDILSDAGSPISDKIMVLRYILEQLVPRIIKSTDPEKVEEFCLQYFGDSLNWREVKSLILQKERASNEVYAKRNAVSEELSKRLEKSADEIVDWAIDALLDWSSRYSDIVHHQYIENFYQYVQDGDRDAAFNSLYQIAKVIKLKNADSTDNMPEAILQFIEHIAVYDSLSQKAREEFESKTSSSAQQYFELIDSTSSYFTSVFSDKSEGWSVGDSLIHGLISIEKDYFSGVKDLECIPVSSILTDKELNPYGLTEPSLPVLLKHLHRPVLKDRIEQGLGIDLANLDLRTQAYVLRFLGSLSLEENNQLKAALDRHQDNREDILVSFISTAESDQHKERIFHILQSYPKELSAEIFKIYRSIVEEANRVREYIFSNLSESQPDKGGVEAIILNLMQKANQIIVKLSQLEPEEGERYVQEIRNTDVEMFLFAATFKSLYQKEKKQESLRLEDFVKFKIEVLSQPVISEGDKKRLLEISSNNWSELPHLRNFVTKGFEEALDNNLGSNYYILRYDQDILGFFRFDDLGENQVYAASFNINSLLRGSSIGEAALHQVLEREAKGKILNATAYPRLPIAKRYIGDFGFIVTGIKDEIISDAGDVEPFFFMEKKESNPDNYSGNNLTLNQVKKIYQDPSVTQKYRVEVYDPTDPESYSFFINSSRAIFEGGWVMSSYRDSREESLVYALFEQRVED